MFFWIVVAIIVILYILIQVNKDNTIKTNAISFTNEIKKKGYNISSIIEYGKKHILIDSSHKTMIFYDSLSNKAKQINFSDIIGMQVSEDGQTTTGIGRAIVGGALFGKAGAIVGAVTGKPKINKIDIIIFLKDVNNPNYTFNFVNGELKKNSASYNRVQECLRKLDGTIRAILN